MNTEQTHSLLSVSIGARSVANTSLQPLPDAGVSVRVATMDDLTFIDELQKKCREQLGFMFLSAIRGKIERGEILVAEESGIRDQESGNAGALSSLTPDSRPLTPVGYCISVDRYSKHDDVGIIYQMNVVPGRQRSFVAATLLKAVFDRAAYGCKLFCCWCAQDLPANKFWEAMGFVPLAFRAGSEKKARVHIFWQKRIRANDVTTPWWFPSKTEGGAMRADRIALPIPPGLRWWDEMPVLRPDATAMLPGKAERKTREKLVPGMKGGPMEPTPKPRAGAKFGAPPMGGVEVIEEKVEEKPKPAKAKREKRKADPKLIAAARELRDRWLEHVNSGAMLIEDAGKYDVARAVAGPSGVTEALLLPGPIAA
jgi:hypothetical protein